MVCIVRRAHCCITLGRTTLNPSAFGATPYSAGKNKNERLEPPHYKSVYKKNSKRTCTDDRPSEWYRGQNWWGGMCISWNSWWRCSIARKFAGGPVKLDSMWQHRLTRPLHVQHTFYRIIFKQNPFNIISRGVQCWTSTDFRLK